MSVSLRGQSGERKSGVDEGDGGGKMEIRTCKMLRDAGQVR